MILQVYTRYTGVYNSDTIIQMQYKGKSVTHANNCEYEWCNLICFHFYFEMVIYTHNSNLIKIQKQCSK